MQARDILDADGSVIGYAYREDPGYGPRGHDPLIESVVVGVIDSYDRAVESAAEADRVGDWVTSIGSRVTIAVPGGPVIHDAVGGIVDGMTRIWSASDRASRARTSAERTEAAIDALAGVVQVAESVIVLVSVVSVAAGLTGPGGTPAPRTSSPRPPPPELAPPPPPVRPAAAPPVGGGGTVLADGAGATAAEMAASRGGPSAGARVGPAERAGALSSGRLPNGRYQCWRCGETSVNAQNMHAGHRNVPRSQGGNLSAQNLACEGAACNLSAQNRGAPTPGMDCASRGGCGTPYGRTDK